jgi:hypothetical protein
MQANKKMQTSKIVLGGLLAVQVAITMNLYWDNRQQQQQMNQPQALFEVEPGQVDKVVISDGSTEVMLQKSALGWVLPEVNDLPANAPQVDAMLQSITRLEPSWPVATTVSGQQRLEVAADHFQRRVQLFSNDQNVGELLLGTSPGFKLAHARRGDSESIFSVPLNNHDFPAQGDGWLDKSLISASDINRIQGPDFALQKLDDQWQFTPGESTTEEEPAKVDEDKAKQLATALASLQVQGIASEQPEGEAIELSVSDDDGSWTYRFVQADEQYTVSRNDRTAVFTVSQFDYERIAQTGRLQLAVQSTAPATPTVEAAKASEELEAAEPVNAAKATEESKAAEDSEASNS